MKKIVFITAILLIASFTFQVNPAVAQTQAAAVPAQQDTTPCGQSYIVRSGDTLREIAIECNVTVSNIMAYNDFIENRNIIIPGWILDLTPDTNEPDNPDDDTIVIPEDGAAATSSGFYVVKAGDTLPYIARRLDLSENDLLVSNPQLPEEADLYTGQILILPGALDEPAAAVSPRVIDPGQNVTIVARGFKKNSEVLIAGGPLGETEQVLKVMNVNGDGALRTKINVPMSTERGQRWSFIVRANDKKDVGTRTNLVYVVDTTGPNESIIYNVRLNDTLSGIAFKFGVELEEILEVNPQIDDNAIIYVGQDILIPGPSLRND